MLDNREIMVSVCCITYNQEKYIQQCLDSIFEQKTNFSFEVIINDDASTDRTPELLKEYKIKYGEKVNLILQKENQFSKGVVILQDIVFPHVRGKYIAFCEGDDYWIDEYKLQKQFDLMEEQKDAAWCTHYVQCVDERGYEITGVTLPPEKTIEPQVMTSAKTIEFMVNNGIQLTSYFIRTELFKPFYEDKPKFVMIAPADDEAMVRYCAAKGSMVFIPEKLTCYRMLSKGSWTSVHEADNDKMRKHYLDMINMIKAFDGFTNHRYIKEIERDLIDKEWKAAFFGKQYKIMRDRRYHEYWEKLPLKTKIKFYVCSLFQ